jgi:hypothetical protein
VEQYFLSHCHGVNWEVATTRIFASYSLRMAGRLRELCERFDRYTADADRTGDRYLSTSLRTYHSIVWLIRDDCARASKDIEGILDAWPGDRYLFQHFTHLFSRCEQAIYAGQPQAAFAAISAEDSRIRRSAMLKINGIRLEYAWLWARIALAMAEVAREGDRASFFRQARRSVSFLRKSDHQTGVAMGALIEAGVCSRRELTAPLASPCLSMPSQPPKPPGPICWPSLGEGGWVKSWGEVVARSCLPGPMDGWPNKACEILPG